jgi:hypothetical protein
LQLGESESRILQELKNAGEKGLSNKELLKIPGMFPSNLSKFLKRLQAPTEPLIERDVKTRRYRILKAGGEVLNTRDEILIISKNRRLEWFDIPSRPPIPPEKGPDLGLGPYILPARTSTYSSSIEEEDTRVYLDFLHFFHTGRVPENPELEVVDSIVSDLEMFFIFRFARLAKDYDVYRVQQMPQRERRAHLRMLAGPYQPREKLREAVDKLEAEYMKKEFPTGPPDLSSDNILDYEGAFLVTISREAIRKDAEKIKKKLLLTALTVGIPGISRDQIILAMGKAGIITDEEARRYFRAKGTIARYRCAEKLRKAYRDQLLRARLLETKA